MFDFEEDGVVISPKPIPPKTISPKNISPTGKKDNRGKAEKSISIKISEERHKRLQKQNAKLTLEIAERNKSLVSVEEIKNVVRMANSKVRQRLESIPSALALQIVGASPAEAEALMRAAIRTALEELAYERLVTRDGVLSESPHTQANDGERVGGPASDAEPGGEQRAGAVADEPSGVPAGDYGRVDQPRRPRGRPRRQ